MTVSMSGDNKTAAATTTEHGLIVVQTSAADQQNEVIGIKSRLRNNKKRIAVAVSAVLIVALIVAGILIGVKFFLDSTNQLVQRSYEFNEGNKKVEQNVTANIAENYVEHHLQDVDKDVWIVNDFNRDLQTTKVKRQLNAAVVCYIKQLNRSDATQPEDVSADDKQDASQNDSVTYFYRAASTPIKDDGIMGTRAKTLCTGTDVFWLTKVCDVEENLAGGGTPRARRETDVALKAHSRQKRCSDTCTKQVPYNCRWYKPCWFCASKYVCDWYAATYSCCKCQCYVEINCRYEKPCWLCSKRWVCDTVLQDYDCSIPIACKT